MSRIAFIIGSMGRGGAERVISILANHYVNKNWDVDVILLLANKVEYDLDSRVRIINLSNPNRRRLFQLPRWLLGIRSYVNKYKPYRIVSFIARINIITMLACIGEKVSVILSERSDPQNDGRDKVTALLTNFLYKLDNCKHVIFQTKYALKCFSKEIRDKGIVTYNPIKVFVKRKSPEKKIVAVGRLSKEKNHKLLIRAFTLLSNDYPDYCLYIYGDGVLKDELQKQIDDIGLNAKIFLPGKFENIHEKISDAKIFVLSSNHEGQSNALLEAMTMGLPCISTNVHGVDEIIENGVNGFIVERDNVQMLYETMKMLIDDESLRRKISDNALITSKVFDANIILKKWEEAIEINS